MSHFTANLPLGSGRTVARRSPAKRMQDLLGDAVAEIVFVGLVAAFMLLAVPTASAPLAELPQIALL